MVANHLCEDSLECFRSLSQISEDGHGQIILPCQTAVLRQVHELEVLDLDSRDGGGASEREIEVVDEPPALHRQQEAAAVEASQHLAAQLLGGGDALAVGRQHTVAGAQALFGG